MNEITPLKYLLLKKPKVRTLYAVTAGVYMGRFLLFVNPLDSQNRIRGSYEVLSIGNGRGDCHDGFEVLSIPVLSFDEGIKKGILEKVEVVDKSLYNVFYNEWKTRKEVKEVKEVKEAKEETEDI